MYNVPLFLLIAAFSLICAGAVTRTLWLFTRQDGAFDVLFGWQKMLDHLYNGSPGRQLLGKALGDCAMCFAFWISPLCFVLHFGVTWGLIGWPISGGLSNLAYFIAWWNLAGFTNFLFIKNIS